MFDKLKLRLTFVNVTVVVLIFVIVFTGVYIAMYSTVTGQSDQLMDMLTYNLVNGSDVQDSKWLGLLGNHAFIIADISGSGQLEGYRSTPLINKYYGGRTTFEMKLSDKLSMLTEEYVKELVDKAKVQTGKTQNLYLVEKLPGSQATKLTMKSGTVRSDSGNAYLTRMINKSDGSSSIIFVSTDYERNLLRSLGLNLIIVAVAGLGLVFAGSLFMAGRALKPVKAAWEKQKSFVADASHELRTPLSVIQTNLELVMENKEDTVRSQLNWLENINVENKHMTKLVGDLLLLARTDSGQTLLEMKEFSLSAAVEEAITPFIPVAAEKNLSLAFSIAPNIDYYGDEARLKQLVVILTDNAVKYTPFGGRIYLELKAAGDSVELAVSDTGEGIAREDLDRIFERFYRADKSRSSETEGTGLGLAIASWIVKEHHGTITADSILEKGTTFKVVLHKTLKHKNKLLF